MNISKIFFFWLFLHTISRTLIWCGICSIWVPAIVLPFIFFCHTFQTLLPVIPHLWLSLDNSSDAFLPSVSFLYDIFFHSSSDKRFFLRGTAMQYHSHIDDWMLRFPLDSTSLSILPVFFDSLSKVSPLSVPILRKMISRLIPWKWCGGFLSSLSVFLLPCSAITYTVNPDTWSLKNFRYFIYLLERVFTGFSSVFVLLFLRKHR